MHDGHTISLGTSGTTRERHQRRRRRTVGIGGVLVALSLGACGVKALPRPPQFVRPQTIEDLRASRTRHGIRLTWSRPTTTVDGRAMKDLDGIIITRATATDVDVAPSSSPDGADTVAERAAFEHIATIHLDDRGRFDKVRSMAFDDTTVTPGTVYLYSVSGFTLDGYVGAPSPAVRARWRGPHGASRSTDTR
jgi:hypothetical protein